MKKEPELSPLEKLYNRVEEMPEREIGFDPSTTQEIELENSFIIGE